MKPRQDFIRSLSEIHYYPKVFNFFWFSLFARVSGWITFVGKLCTVFCRTCGDYDIFFTLNRHLSLSAEYGHRAVFRMGSQRGLKFGINPYNGCVDHWTLHNDTEVYRHNFCFKIKKHRIMSVIYNPRPNYL